MTLDEYQQKALVTADYPLLGENMLYPALGAAEEAGEIAGKVKKLWRNHGIVAASHEAFTFDKREAIIKEIGDNLWYLAAMCNELGTTLENAAQINLDKLADRKVRGVIKSEGDDR